jgi:hypothetical protein
MRIMQSYDAPLWSAGFMIIHIAEDAMVGSSCSLRTQRALWSSVVLLALEDIENQPMRSIVRGGRALCAL